MTAPPLPPAFLRHPLAHRALHGGPGGAPENSRAAVAAAVASGYGIEIDVQPSADGAAMVFHDADLGRLTGASGAVRARRSEALSAISLRGGGEGIPRLREILALVAGRVPLLIEMKDQSGRQEGSDGALESGVAAALDGYDGPVAVMSFNPDMIADLARRAPQIPRGLTTSAWRRRDAPRVRGARRRHLRDIPDVDRLGACFISHHHLDLERPRVRGLRAAGLPVLCWTIRSAAEERLARERADNITFEHYRPLRPTA